MQQPKIRFRSKEIPVPSASFSTMERFDEDGTLKEIPIVAAAYQTKEAREKAARVLVAALSQEFTEVTIEEARAALTPQNVVPVVVLWILGIPESEVRRVEARLEATLAGEASSEAKPGEAPRP